MLNCICIIDEAGNLFSKELSQAAGSGYISAAKRAITQVRKSGVGILAGAQVISETDESLKGNVSSVIGLGSSNPKDARETAQLLSLPETIVPEFQSLAVAVGFAKSDGFSAAVQIQIPNFNLGPFLSDGEVARRMSPEFAALEKETIRAPKDQDIIQPISYLEILGETTVPDGSNSIVITVEPKLDRFFDEHRALLQEIDAHPTASVTEHYRNLGWSTGRADRVKRQLLEMGLILSGREKSRNGRPREILTLTEQGKKIVHENTES